ncbi:MAG: histidine kinase [Bacteroidota bacterium]
MKSPSLSSRKIEPIVLGLIWLFVFTIPFFTNRSLEQINWGRVTKDWICAVFYLFVFLTNVYWLIPKYLFQKKYLNYSISALLLVVLATVAILIAIRFNAPIHPGGLNPANIHPPQPPPKPMLMEIIDNLIILILVIGGGIAFRLIEKWLSEEKLRMDAEKEQLKSSLALLRQQISPHFFMNTLNNIHALIDYDKEIAQDAVIKLSQLMRVLLYENENYTLQNEINFVQDYIELMKIRLSENVEVIFDYPATIPQINFPPLLFVNFIENSFKHGILAVGNSFIHINFSIENAFLAVKITNFKTHNAINYIRSDKIGMNNSKKRLDLIYGKNYTFEVIETTSTYEVNVKVPFHEN